MAYVVGLIATDGCLISGRTRIDFCSVDREMVETYLACLGRAPHRFRVDRTALGSPLYRASLKDAQLYRWLIGVLVGHIQCAWLYADPAAPCLDRKRAIWLGYAERNRADVTLAMQNKASAVARAATARWARRDSNPHALTSRSS